MKNKKRFTRKQLEEMRDEVISKQQELIKMQELKVATLQNELAQMKCDVDFEQTQRVQQRHLETILGSFYPFWTW